MTSDRPVRACTIALAILCAGCNGGGDLPRTVPVTGKVTYKGQPVAGATVLFTGEGELRTATAITSSDGGYELMTLDAKGAMPGAYAVVVTKTELEVGKAMSMEEAAKTANQPLPQPKQFLPAKYGDATKTPLRFEVKDSGPNVFDLVLAD